MDDLEVQGQELGGADGGDSQGASRGLVLAALGVGVLGLIAGGAGVFMAMNASSALSAYKAELDSRPDPAEVIETRLKDMDERLVNVGAEIVRANNTSRQTRDQFQRALTDLSTEVRNNRTQINKNTVTLTEIAESGVSRRPAPVAAASNPSPSESSNAGGGSGGETTTSSSTPATTAPGGAVVHTIVSGDSFWKLATKYNVSIEAIKAANPDVDPGRLQLGQKVRIPPAPGN